MFRPRFYYDPQPATATPGGAPPAPAAPATPPPAAPAVPEVPELPPNARVILDDGSVATVSDLIAARKNSLNEEQRKEFELFQRAKNGDAEAMLEIAGVRRDPPAPQVHSDPVVAALEAEVKALKDAVAQTQPAVKMFSDINTLREDEWVRGRVEEYQTKLPYLAHALKQEPTAARVLTTEIRDAVALAKQANLDPRRPEVFDDILAQVLVRADTRIKSTASMFGATWKPADPAAPAAPPMKTATGQPVRTDVPSPASPGSAMPPNPTTPDKKYTLSGLVERMRASAAARAGL